MVLSDLTVSGMNLLICLLTSLDRIVTCNCLKITVSSAVMMPDEDVRI